MFSICCSCIQKVFDKDNDGVPDFLQTKHIADSGSHLDGLMKRNLNSIRGRREHIRNIPINILPTKFDDDEELPDEDEEGEDIPILNHGVFAEQYFEKIRKNCLKSGALFVDPMFPPTNASVFVNKKKWQQNDNNIEWKRASELCENAMLFVDGASRFDINQGEIGECWLLAAMANLTLHRKLLNQVVL